MGNQTAMDIDESDRAGFRLLTEDDVTAAVAAELHAEHPNRAVLKGWLEDAYKIQTGTDPASGSPAVQKAFAGWLNRQSESEVPFLLRCWPRLELVLHGSFSGKLHNLAQRPCFICHGGRPLADLFPIHVLPVRIGPKSRQAMKSGVFKAFQAAVESWFAPKKIELGMTGKLCVAVTFVLNDKGRDKDLDNMVKAFLDALSRALGFDDRNVHHLDVVKLIVPTEEEYLYVRLAPSALNDHGDVVAPVMHHTFATAPALDLEKFLPCSASALPRT